MLFSLTICITQEQTNKSHANNTHTKKKED